MFSPPPFPSWAPQLLTGDRQSDSEHRLLLSAMARLRELCVELGRQADGGGEIDTGEVIDAVGDVLAFMVDHFYAEERLMKDACLDLYDRELCNRHREDHAAISEAVLRIICNRDEAGAPPLIRELQRVLERWLEHHMEIHDRLLVRLLGAR